MNHSIAAPTQPRSGEPPASPFPTKPNLPRRQHDDRGDSHRRWKLSGAGSIFLMIIWGLGGSGCATNHPSSPTGRLIFDGKSLAEWKAPDMSFWRVEDGAITGETTATHQPPHLQFIVWEGGQPGDFQLTFQFRIFGAKSNSGMQFRSQAKANGDVHGYQADMDGAGKYLGGIWDEFGTRNSLAGRGERVVIDETGRRTVTRFAPADTLLAGIQLSDWNTYQITAIGPHLTLRINGQITAELEDRESGKAATSGVLAMAVIPGEPMKVQFRDLRLREGLSPN